MGMELAIALLVALTVITLVGHGIWVLLAALFGRGGKRLHEQPRVPCVYCGYRTAAHDARCGWCGRDLKTPQAAELADLQAFGRQLQRLREAGSLDPSLVDDLLRRVEAYRAALPPPLLKSRPEELAPPRAESPRPAAVVAEVADNHSAAAERTAAKVAGATSLPLEPTGPQANRTAPRATAGSSRSAEPPPTPALLNKPAPEPSPPRPSPPAPPRKSFAEMLAGFMEERNIRWGELIGGLLIVGSSVALVLSLWDRLKDVRYVPFLIFAAVASAIFGVGRYAHHRWKLASTSRALLLIATLLVPLNFLFLAILGQQAAWDLLTVVIALAALGWFAWLVDVAGRVILPIPSKESCPQGHTPRQRGWLGRMWRAGWPRSQRWHVLGVLGGSAAALLAARFADADARLWPCTAVGGFAVLCFAVSVGGSLTPYATKRRLDVTRVAALLILLGTATFALAVALGLLVAQAADVAGMRYSLSLLAALAATPILAAGLTVMRGTARDAAAAAWHTAGTAVALAGMTAMLAALGLAWPCPLAIVAVGALACVALVFAAFTWRLPALHAGAIAFATLGYLVVFHALRGALPWLPGEASLSLPLLRLLAGPASGTALLGPVLFFALIAQGLTLRGNRRHARLYAGGCGVMVLLSLLLVTWHGWHGAGPGAFQLDALWAATVYVVYGFGIAATMARWRRIELGYLAVALFVAAPLWVLWWHPLWRPLGPLWAAVLGSEALLLVLGGTPQPLGNLYRTALLHGAEIAAPAALALGAWTAWRQSAAIAAPAPAPIVTALTVAAAYLLLAWEYRSPSRVWLGSTVVLAGLVHSLVCNYTTLTAQPWLVALLTHASLAILAAAALDAPAKRRAAPSLAGELAGVFAQPLSQSALCSAILAVVVSLLVSWADTTSLACCLYWLAAVWLLIAWQHRDATLWAIHQGILVVATAVATTAWLQGHGWIETLPQDIFLPQNLQAYGLALGLLALVWIAVRIALRRNDVAQRLLHPDYVAVDRLLRHALIVSQLLLILVCLWYGLAAELIRGSVDPAFAQSAQIAAYGGSAWVLLAVLAVAMTAALWDRWGAAELASTLLLAATVPCLVAGRFAGDVAAASALRWGMGACFLVSSLAVWNRQGLAVWCQRARMRLTIGGEGPRIARAVSLATTAFPVLTVTLAAAALRLAGVARGGPAAGTFFHELGPSISYLIPLALVLAGIVGYALREASAGYAFSGGWIAEMIVVLGYALRIATDPSRSFDAPELVTLLQLATLTAAVWALIWLVARQGINVWRELPQGDAPLSRALQPRPMISTMLMNAQIGLAAAGNMLLVGAALLSLALLPAQGQDWTAAAGRPLGWAALALAAAAGGYRLVQLGRRLSPQRVGLLGMAALGLLACTMCWALPQWGYGPAWAYTWAYRTMMLGWAAYALLIVSVTWWVASLHTSPQAQGPPQALIATAAVWVRVAGMAAVVLGLKAAFLHGQWDDLLWAAAGIAVASIAAATMAVWQRREGWAFAAALGVNVAASLVVWYVCRTAAAFDQWWLTLLEANVIASAAVALAWLAARKRLYQLRQLQLRHSPLLAVQVLLPVAGHAMLLTVPVAWLLQMPAHVPSHLAREIALLAGVPGWIGLLLTAAAVGWYVRQVLPAQLLHVVGGLALATGVLFACYAANTGGGKVNGQWLAYHTLIIAWAVAGLLVLGIGWLAQNLQLSPQDEPKRLDARRLPSLAAGQVIFPRSLVQAWVTLIGAVTVAMAVLHAADDPAGAWYAMAAVLGVSVAAGLLAMWLRLGMYVFLCGLLWNVVGTIGWTTGTVAWLTWSPGTLTGLLQVNALGLAIGSAVWSLLRFAHRAGVPDLNFAGTALRFNHLAGALAVGLSGTVVGAGVAADVLGVSGFHFAVAPIDWVVLAAVALAALIGLCDRGARFALPELYCLAFVAEGMQLCARNLAPRSFCWRATCQWAGLVLGAAVLGWLLPQLRRALAPSALGAGLRTEPDRSWHHHAWFLPLQASNAAVAAALSTWVALDFAFDGAGADVALLGLSGRLSGTPAALMLVGAAILMAWQTSGSWRSGWQYAAMACGVLLSSSLGWCRLDAAAGTPTGDAPWLHRSVNLMIATAMMTLLSGFGLRSVLARTNDWIAAGRRITPLWGGLALMLLAAVLGQEAWLVASEGSVAMATWAITVVATALAVLAGVCVAFALLPQWDPLGLSDRGRTSYVYCAEILLALVGIHVRLTIPWLFHLAILRTYWMPIVMAASFGGAGLAELFQRRNLRVLAEPLRRTALLLPAAPAIGFWFLKATTSATWFVGDASPAAWLLMGLFYGYLAASGRSLTLAAVSLATGNMGLWVLWQRCGLGFFERPQLWLIPPALAALVAEQLDRRRLSASQRAALRYLALSVIYVSSTTEFLRGIGDSLALPLVLSLLCVTGVLAGILLRVRSFLYLGVSFLLVVIVRMIAYAASQPGQIWVFWVSCIFLGAAIIALFALFEKRRSDVLSAVERLKQWKP